MLLEGLNMIFTSFLTIFLLSSCWAIEKSSDDGIPFVVTSARNSNGPKMSGLLPEDLDVPPLVRVQPTNKARSDIDIVDDQPTGGYFYPKPARSFDLPEFKTLDAAVQLDASFAEENIQRQSRASQRPYTTQYVRPTQPISTQPIIYIPGYIPGIIPPSPVSPITTVYGRPY